MSKQNTDFNTHFDEYEFEVHYDSGEKLDIYAKAYHEFLTYNEISFLARCVHLRLLIYAGTNKTARPSYGALIKEFELKDKRTIMKAIKQLEQHGWIKVIRRYNPETKRHYSNEYIVRVKTPNKSWALNAQKRTSQSSASECTRGSASECTPSNITIQDSNSISLYPSISPTNEDLEKVKSGEREIETWAKELGISPLLFIEQYQELRDLAVKSFSKMKDRYILAYAEKRLSGYEHEGLIYCLKSFNTRMKKQGKLQKYYPQLNYWLKNKENEYGLDTDYKKWKSKKEQLSSEKSAITKSYSQAQKESQDFLYQVEELAKTNEDVAAALAKYKETQQKRKGQLQAFNNLKELIKTLPEGTHLALITPQAGKPLDKPSSHSLPGNSKSSQGASSTTMTKEEK